MTQYVKAKRYLYYFIGGLLLSFLILGLWIGLLVNTTGSKPGDIVLLAILFFIIIGGQGLFLFIYLKRPAVLLALDEEEVTIFLSKKKDIKIPFSELSSFGKIRRNVVIITKKNEVFMLRFLKKDVEAEASLKRALNTFINHHPDRYFSKNLFNNDQAQKK